MCFFHRHPADFVLLMCASQQWKVFDCEKTEEWMVLAGENTDDPDPMEGRLFNPAPNFINCRSASFSPAPTVHFLIMMIIKIDMVREFRQDAHTQGVLF